MKKLYCICCALFVGMSFMLTYSTIYADDIEKEMENNENIFITLVDNKQQIPLSYSKLEDKLVYYLHPSIVLSEEKQNQIEMSDEMNKKVARISYCGYNEKENNTLEWYVATQLYIWEELGYTFEVHNFDEYEMYKHKIQDKQMLLDVLPSFNDSKITLKKGKEEILTDENNVIMNFIDFICRDDVILNVVGNALHIQTDKNSGVEGVIEYSLSNEKNMGLPIVYIRDDGTTSMIHPDESYITKGAITYRIQPYAKIMIQNRGENIVRFEKEFIDGYEIYKPIYEYQMIEDVKLNLYAKEDIYDVWENKVYEKDAFIETISNGISSDLLPGKYYLKEESCANEYVLNDTVYDITLKENELIHSIENKHERKKIIFHFTKNFEQDKKMNIGNVNQDVVLGVYTDNDFLIPKDSLVDVLKLDEYGNISKELHLPIGSYYVKEIKTNDYYELDEKKYKFKIVKDVNNIQLVMNEAISNSYFKRNTLFIQSIDKEDKTPIQSKYVLYDKNMNIIDTFKTDKEGTYEYKDLIQDTYYLQEIGKAKGYKLNTKLMEINMNEDKEIYLKSAKSEMETYPVETGDSDRLRCFEVMMLSSMSSIYLILFKKIVKR